MTLHDEADHMWHNAIYAANEYSKATGDIYQPLVVVFAPDSIHPTHGSDWWAGMDADSIVRTKRDRDHLLGGTYAVIQDSDYSIADAKRVSTASYAYPCFYVCDCLRDIEDALENWVALGVDPIGYSDSDCFTMGNYYALTFTQEYSDLHERNVI